MHHNLSYKAALTANRYCTFQCRQFHSCLFEPLRRNSLSYWSAQKKLILMHLSIKKGIWIRRNAKKSFISGLKNRCATGLKCRCCKWYDKVRNLFWVVHLRIWNVIFFNTRLNFCFLIFCSKKYTYMCTKDRCWQLIAFEIHFFPIWLKFSEFAQNPHWIFHFLNIWKFMCNNFSTYNFWIYFGTLQFCVKYIICNLCFVNHWQRLNTICDFYWQNVLL